MARTCYAAPLGGCEGGLTGEHYFSEGIFRLMAGEDGIVTVTGLPWLPPGESLDVPSARLIAKVLCRRHNEALSGIDAAAIKVWAALLDVEDELPRGTEGHAPPVVDGNALELWMVKLLAGSVAARLMLDGNKRFTFDIPIEWLHLLFRPQIFLPKMGAYFIGRVGDDALPPGKIGGWAAVFADAPAGRVPCSLILDMRGLRFLVALFNPPEEAERQGPVFRPLLENAIWRPERLRFQSAVTGSEREVRFSWRQGHSIGSEVLVVHGARPTSPEP